MAMKANYMRIQDLKPPQEEEKNIYDSEKEKREKAQHNKLVPFLRSLTDRICELESEIRKMKVTEKEEEEYRYVPYSGDRARYWSMPGVPAFNEPWTVVHPVEDVYEGASPGFSCG